MIYTRALVFLSCLLCVVLLSSQDMVFLQALNHLTEYRVPRWVYLLPLSATIAFVVAQIFFVLLSIPKLSSKGKAVFITGCDSGFGYHLAKHLCGKGYYVFAGCLFPKSESGAGDLVKECLSAKGGLSIVPCDVTSQESLNDAVVLVTRRLGDRVLWAVIANAGVAANGYLEWCPEEKIQNLFDVNLFGIVKTFKAFVHLLRQSKGRLVVTTSWAGRVSPPTLVPYAMTKHAAVALCDGLRAELQPFGISVSSIEPNMYRTSMIPATTKELDVLWASLNEEQQNSYGKVLLKRSRIMAQDFCYLCQDDLSTPVSCFEHAVSARFPMSSYYCDRMSTWVLTKLMLCLPEEFMNVVNFNMHSLLICGRNFLYGRYA